MIKEEHLLSDAIQTAPLLDIDQLGMQFGSAVILAPHPDDEALGCGGMISYLRSQNIPVYVVFMTSGGKSHPNSAQYPSDLLTNLRESEALKSCEILGVPKDCVIFYRQSDGELNKLKEDNLKELENKLGSLLSDRKIASLFIPWRRDVHSDHLICNRIGTQSVKRSGMGVQLVEYPIWLWKNSRDSDWPHIDETTAFRLRVETVKHQKQAAIYAHESQTSNLISDDPSGFILTEELLAPFLGAYEYFFIAKDDKMEALDQHFFESLYAENADPWNFKHSEYEHQKYQRTDALLLNRHYKRGLELGCSIGIQTPFFAQHCDELLSVDVSMEAIADAKKNNQELTNVDFQVLDVTADFPNRTFDFISMCEMGYYFNKRTLKEIFKKINEHMDSGGELLMVHWTSYVREFPLHGTEVNKIFKEFNKKENAFSCVITYIHDSYELFLWKKI